ncbi:hypothetical protein Dimus_008425 [Dionaea muscipula]
MVGDERQREAAARPVARSAKGADQRRSITVVAAIVPARSEASSLPYQRDPSRRPSTQSPIVHSADQSPLTEHPATPLSTISLPSSPAAATVRRDYSVAAVGSGGVDGVGLLIAGQ